MTNWIKQSKAILAYCLLAVFLPATHSLAFEMRSLSSHPQLVTAGDVLIEITSAQEPPQVFLTAKSSSSANSAPQNVSQQFARDPTQPQRWLGLVSGLANGENELVASSASQEARLKLINHPVNATLFAGPQQSPFLCELEDNGLKAAPGARLDPFDSPDCSAVTTITYFYRNKTGRWLPFDPAGPRPDQIAMTRTSDDRDVPLIVRQEKGVINRSAYVISILHDPAAGPVPTPLARGGSGWNGKLMYSFGGAVQANYHMGRKIGDMNSDLQFLEDTIVGFRDGFITRGYAIAAGSLSVFGTNNDDVKSAETLAKIKERFIKLYGPPVYTIATGVSGGSMQQHLIANAYPGLLDGLLPGRSYMDTMTFLQPIYDCELLNKVFKTGSWTRDQLNAVSGKYWGYCVSNGTRYPNARPDFCDLAVLDMIENAPAKQEPAVRCTFQDNLVTIFGRDPKTGFARSPFDNIGVQYGLKALNDGLINWEQFLGINQRIGGFDVNGKIIAQRMAGDPLALARAYETGRIVEATGGLADVPMISVRSYNDGDPTLRGDPNVDVHDGYHSQIIEARLTKYLGSSANYVQFMTATYGYPQLDAQTLGGPLNTANLDSLTAMDAWLMAIDSDHSNRTRAEKVSANRPANLVNRCYPAKEGAILYSFSILEDWQACKALFPTYSDARLAAGAPASNDIFKCQLKPIEDLDYVRAPNASQLSQLQIIFPNGVCDWSKPGIGQTQKIVTWARFTGDGAYEPIP